jgi:GT2 family glycosyltransferase
MQLKKTSQMFFISGFCFIVRTAFFDKIGWFDMIYTPAGFEDIDFCLKGAV